MDSQLFDRLKESMLSVNNYNRPNKSMVFGVDRQIECVANIKQLPPGSPERFNLVCVYVNLSCSTFAHAVYDPTKHKEPIITWTDIEGNLDGFAEFLNDLCHKDYSQESTG